MEYQYYHFIGLTVIVFFIWMDIGLYHHIQDLSLKDFHIPTSSTHYFDNISPYAGIMSPKIVLCDPFEHYILVPLVEIFDKWTNFSTVCSFITPNAISVFHIMVSIVAGRLVMSDSISVRRFGVILFFFSTWLDNLDGHVFRMHTNRIGDFSSVHHSVGYYVDAVSDFTEGIILAFAVYIFLRRRGLSKTSAGGSDLLPTYNKDPSLSPSLKNGLSFVHRRQLEIRIAVLMLSISLCCYFWDKYVDQYDTILMRDPASEEVRVLQLDLYKSASTWIIMWFWRNWNAHAWLTYMQCAVFADEMPVFLRWTPWLCPIGTLCLSVATELHLHSARLILHAAS